MHRSLTILPVLALSAATAFAQAPAPAMKAAAKPAAAKQAATAKKEPLVEFEMMTWPEVKAALAAGNVAKTVGMRSLDVRVKGPGSGRESAIRALQTVGIEVKSIRDVTPIPHNGCRPPKRRRV